MAHIVMVLIGNIRYDGRVRKEIDTLMAAGHHVELITSDFDKIGSGGEDLGVQIHYIPITLLPNPAMNFLERLLFNRKAASIIKSIAPTHVHCHDLSSLLAGVWSKESVEAKLIFDAHELMPESMGGIREKIWNYIEGRCIKYCDFIVMPEKNRIAYFRQKYQNIPEPLLLENFPRKGDIPRENLDLFREKYPISREQKIILHIGLLHPRRGIEELIDSMLLCSEKFVLIILGTAFKGYQEILRKKILNLTLEHRVFIHQPVPHTEILQYMSSCDVGTAFYRNSNLNNYYCASNKIFEFIALGKSVLTNDYPGLLETVEYYGQGICLGKVTPENLAAAYSQASDLNRVIPGVKKYFWEDRQETLIHLYED